MSERAKYDPAEYTPMFLPGELRATLKTEISERFLDGMRARMAVSYHKYGPVAEGYPDRVDAIACLGERIRKYQETGNVEWLIDVANFAMIEFMHPRHKEAHYRPTDSDESPGRLRVDEADSMARNIPTDVSVENLKRKQHRDGD